MECQWRDVELVGLQMWFRHWVCQRGGNKMGAQNRADNTSIYRALPGTTLGATKVSGHIITSKYICFVTHPDLQYPWAG